MNLTLEDVNGCPHLKKLFTCFDEICIEAKKEGAAMAIYLINNLNKYVDDQLSSMGITRDIVEQPV